ncbi:hypothetical protein JTB14_021362 [Gonioctena quinquepunctata]|nr:hypothetical protein JTB14_021362 [Gonioctena quinquepunctata]
MTHNDNGDVLVAEPNVLVAEPNVLVAEPLINRGQLAVEGMMRLLIRTETVVRIVWYLFQLENNDMAPQYRVHYFDFTGRGEPIRMLLTYGGLEFDDIRIDKKDWPRIKPTLPLGQLPVLEIDGKLYPQTTAILKYLAKEVRLAGNNSLDDLKIDVAVDTLVDLQNKIYDFAFEEDQEMKKIKEEKLYSETIPYYLKRLEDNAKANGGHLGINR